jgi:DHA1 family bicyclomycin/chloramphenicol resistance-like MFS transporter
MNPGQPRQKFLGSNGLIVLIALLSAFVPLSTDLYLPALPGMGTYFNVSSETMNLTLTGFFIAYAVGTLFWGPLSDRHGRKPMLLIGLAVYGVASALCSQAWSANALVVFRIFQALGGSAAGAIATAMVKDVYSGHKRESVLAIVQSMTLISPAVAPVIGAFLMKVTSWRGIFLVLTGIGIVAWIGCVLLEETIPARSSGGLAQSFSRLGKVLQNRSFTLLMVLFSLGSVSSMAFISSSTYIYQDGFHLSSQIYSYFFSFNALGMILGPMVFLQLSKRIHSETIIKSCYWVIAGGGVLLCLLGNLKAWVFALCMMPILTASNCSRPPASNLMLEQQKEDIGSASSVMGCAGLLLGSLGMQLISLGWSNKILVLGIMTLITSVTSLLLWPLAIRNAKRLPGPNETALEAREGLDGAASN